MDGRSCTANTNGTSKPRDLFSWSHILPLLASSPTTLYAPFQAWHTIKLTQLNSGNDSAYGKFSISAKASFFGHDSNRKFAEGEKYKNDIKRDDNNIFYIISIKKMRYWLRNVSKKTTFRNQ